MPDKKPAAKKPADSKKASASKAVTPKPGNKIKPKLEQ